MSNREYNEVLEFIATGIELCSQMTASYLEAQNQIQKLAVGLLAGKAIEHLEATHELLKKSHLESCKVLLRVAIETIGLLGLCLDKQEVLEEWMFLTSVRRDRFSEDRRYVSFVQKLQRDGRKYYDQRLNSADEGPASKLVESFNSHVHASWSTLLRLVGFKAVEGTFPAEANQALEESDGNLKLAVRRFLELRLQSRSSFQRLQLGRESDGSLWGEQEETTLELMVGTHHLFDLLDESFGILKGNAAEFGRWHKQSLIKMGAPS